VLSIVVSDYLYKRFHLAEGTAKLRASLVCEKIPSAAAEQIKLGDYLLLLGGQGREMTGGTQRPSRFLPTPFEAVMRCHLPGRRHRRAADFGTLPTSSPPSWKAEAGQNFQDAKDSAPGV